MNGEFVAGWIRATPEIVEQRQGFLFAVSPPFIGWFAPDIGLDAIKGADEVSAPVAISI
ncbi:hypothetical protein OHD62_32790 [Mesorhizobium sp. YC-39]|uniref:hypothetical protein n=1 Tax=unclassified Mesorhizobium TaxID=325217 RepID=UPI0021E72F91|nr:MULTISPECIES: hypothetical protein [unclassified Mesorhizobium]MCV3211487.1 hypothetical protein [Mesorhizobium sp. YC-2]MCV3233157.1 hypothetical protein [Mesorhizobium sp. YC-39]